MATHKWQFASRFRRGAFGWRSETPIQRIMEALAEIKQAARQEPVIAAEGAVTFLEKLSPALEHVDGSSGAMGRTVNHAIDTLVPVIANAEVDERIRQRWLDRLWQALQDDERPFIEVMGEYWGDLCATPKLASTWADVFLPEVKQAWSVKPPAYRYFKGTSACLACLHAAGRHEELLALLDHAHRKWWWDRRWGVRSLLALGRKAEALRYAEDSRGQNEPLADIARTCEEILLSSGLVEEAYRRYALVANQGMTYLARFRAIAKKYPHVTSAEILRDLAASTPGEEGKWFAAAKEAGLYDLAIEFATRCPADPRTLARAARDYRIKRPGFAVASGLAALRWISLGHGYEITGLDVLDAYAAVMQAAPGSGVAGRAIKEQVREMTVGAAPGNLFLKVVLAKQLED